VPEAGILKINNLRQLWKELTQNFLYYNIMTPAVNLVRTVPSKKFI